ncbi:tricarboxylate transporter [Pseudorhizobium endolithicum]|uniref:Tricarboxylate transporter n=1 Tax=Pseudorhizobium endolithicum TaxID=1191678 RepID=A0ABM8PHX0_9HYPH|nr:tripartite tricarboxylate transporter permease [Pseudorhizobium endolithicum]CAD7031018.1 tricarboxylate transporter [Pseudorhizobium endolithicum]
MAEIILNSLATLFTVNHLFFMLVGIMLGLVVGILPALGGIAGMSLLLPFIYGMDPTSAIAMMIGLLAILPTSDTFSSILMGIPGSSASQATVLDGFPLAKKGEAARALSAAFTASLFGGVFGALILTGMVVIARPLILSFGSAELFMLAIFGLSMVGILSGSSLGKGIASCALGLALGSVGTAPANGSERFTFDSLYLMSGIQLAVVGLGIFALPEIVDLLRSNQSISSSGKLGKGWRTGVLDVWKSRWLALRCSGFGALIGMIPGLGGSVVDWLAYGHALQTTKDREEFGKGDIRGVIAPESANNACAGGALVPTLLFGIPGSGSMAIFLAAMILIGIQPGPSMADPSRDLNLTYTIIWTLALANVVGAGLCLLLSPSIAKLTTIKYTLFAPFMIIVISFGAFQASRSFSDMVALLIVGLIGIFLKRFGWPRPAFLIGFVLAGQVETYLYQAVQFDGWGFLQKPIVIVIALITIASIWFGSRKRPTDETEKALDMEGDSEHARAGNLFPQIVFSALALIVFVYVLYGAYDLPFLDKIFPMAVAVVGILSSTMILLPQLRARNSGGDSSVNFDADAHAEDGGPWRFVAWLVGFVALIGLVGFFLALAAFFIAFMRTVAKASWKQTVVLTAGAALMITILAWFLNMQLPAGMLQDHFYAYLPWPLN